MDQITVKSSQPLAESFLPWANYNFNQWASGVEMPPHSHQHLQIIHVLNCELEVDWGAGWQNLEKNDVHLLPPLARHRLRSPKGHRQFGLNFAIHKDQRGILAELLTRVEKPLRLRCPYPDLSEERFPLSSGRTALDRLKLAHELEGYSLSILRRLSPGSEEDSLATKIRDYFSPRLSVKETVGESAEALGVSRATLQRACLKTFGMGVGEYRESIRLRTIAEISEEFGYPDGYSLSRAFKVFFRVSPRDFRRQTREG